MFKSLLTENPGFILAGVNLCFGAVQAARDARLRFPSKIARATNASNSRATHYTSETTQ